MKLFTAAAMREADRRTSAEFGISGAVLMESAGRAVAEALLNRYAQRFPGPVVLFCGKGNNGGDGYVVARQLRNRGWQVVIVVLAEEQSLSGDARVNLEILKRLDSEIYFTPELATLEPLLAKLASPSLLVDGLLGTGLTVPVSGLYGRAIEWINAQSAPVIAIDLPSGLDADRGQVLGCAISAELTVALAAAKLGQVLHPGVALCGELVVAEIGIPTLLLEELACGSLLDREEVRPWLPHRPPAGHKGSFGHLLVVAGSLGKTGAATLTANAALRSGTGLVTVAAPQSAQATLAIKLTEAMTAPLDELDGELALTAAPQLAALWQGKTLLALGPGLGRGAPVGALVRSVVRDCPLPLVIDADGLFALAGKLELLAARPVGTTILTPHPGEMAQLLGLSIAQVEADRVGVARQFAETYGVVLVLKGARTVIAAPDGGLYINPTGHAGLATAGTGDVLTGIIAGLLAQGIAPLAAACAGVWLHGQAANRLLDRFGDAGLLATDLLAEIPAARLDLFDSLPSGGRHA